MTKLQPSTIVLPDPGNSREAALSGPEGLLQALITMPKNEPRGLAVICHPHPLHGGTMANKVVYSLASSARRCNLLTVRFNFRGVERSEGHYDAGRGETDDTLAVIDWVRQEKPGLPLLLAGFSFGAYVSLCAASSAKPAWLISVSIPLGRVRAEFGQTEMSLPSPPSCPWLAVHSRDDEIVDFVETERQLLTYRPPPKLVALNGAGHFYGGHLADLQKAVIDFLVEQGLSA